MTPFLRIKNHIINLQNLAYVAVGDDFVDFAFSPPGRRGVGQNRLQFKKGVDLQESEFEEVRDFVLQLPDPDRVVVV